MPAPLKRSRRNARDVRRTHYAANVADAVGPIEHGCEIYGLTRGQFSLIDLMEHILATTGPADLTISTWTAAGADIDYALRLTKDGRVRSILWIVDSSFPVRQPGYCRAMLDRFGPECIRVTENHAKFVLIGNDEWNVVLRTSMNLNENRRLESWEISDDVEMYDYLASVVGDVFAGEPNADAGRQANRAAFDSLTEANSDPNRRIRYIK